MRHPFQVAKEIADLIKNDPAAARLVKDYMSKEELLNALELYPTDEELLNWLKKVPVETAELKDDRKRLLSACNDYEKAARQLERENNAMREALIKISKGIHENAFGEFLMRGEEMMITASAALDAARKEQP